MLSHITDDLTYVFIFVVMLIFRIFTRQNAINAMNKENHISRDVAIGLLKKYNKDPFHLRHALTVEAVMR